MKKQLDDKGLAWKVVILTALGLTLLWFYLVPDSLLFEEESLGAGGWLLESIVRFAVCLCVSIGAFVHLKLK